MTILVLLPGSGASNFRRKHWSDSTRDGRVRSRGRPRTRDKRPESVRRHVPQHVVDDRSEFGVSTVRARAAGRHLPHAENRVGVEIFAAVFESEAPVFDDAGHGCALHTLVMAHGARLGVPHLGG